MFLRQHVTTLFPEKVGAGTLGHPVEMPSGTKQEWIIAKEESSKR